jgi:hypothetical protein
LTVALPKDGLAWTVVLKGVDRPKVGSEWTVECSVPRVGLVRKAGWQKEHWVGSLMGSG